MIRQRLGALALASVIGLLVLFGVYRIGPVDVPWHLATGRLALATGHLPVTNTFSWTYPDFPLRQQYPLFQLPLAWLVDHVGFTGFELFNLALWTLAGLAWMLAAGPLKDAARQPLLWLYVVLGLQRHHVPRPEVFTVLGMGLVLLGLDRYARTRRPGWLLGVVAAQWLMVNGHQLWMLGLLLQVSFLAHLAAVRQPRIVALGADPTDAAVPILPPLLALGGSLAVLPLSPLGLHVYWTPIGVLGTVLEQGAATSGGAQAQELLPVWHDPLALFLYLGSVLLVVLWASRSRRAWSPHDWIVLGGCFAMASMAVRGISFFVLATGWFVQRATRRAAPLLPEDSVVHLAASATTIALAVALGVQIQGAEPSYLARQAGFGRSHGEWADSTAAFLRADPPPGRLMNLSWVAGNALVGLYPEIRLFVDPRFESYPRDFLLQAIASTEDGAVLRQLVDQWQPTYVVAEMRDEDVRARVAELVASGDWVLVHVDSVLCVVVRRVPETAEWLARHEAPLERLTVDDWVDPSEGVLLAEQRIRVAALYRALGRADLAAPLLEAARTRDDDPRVSGELARLNAAR